MIEEAKEGEEEQVEIDKERERREVWQIIGEESLFMLWQYLCVYWREKIWMRVANPTI